MEHYQIKKMFLDLQKIKNQHHHQLKSPTEVVDVQSEPTLVETMKTISRNGFIREKSSFSALHIIAFVLLIPAAIVAIPGFLILLLSDYLKED